MSVTITSLRVDYKTSEWEIHDNVNYAIINATFKIQDDDVLHRVAVNYSKEWNRTLTIDDPEKYNRWIVNDIENFPNGLRYPNYNATWVLNDPTWRYIEKFDTFHFREWIADTPVTRSVIHEIEYYKKFGKLPSIYRSTDEWILINHFRTLNSYWD